MVLWAGGKISKAVLFQKRERIYGSMSFTSMSQREGLQSIVSLLALRCFSKKLLVLALVVVIFTKYELFTFYSSIGVLGSLGGRASKAQYYYLHFGNFGMQLSVLASRVVIFLKIQLCPQFLNSLGLIFCCSKLFSNVKPQLNCI